MTEIDAFEKEILNTLLQAANMKTIVNNEHWQKYINTKLITLGIAAATQREVARKGYVTLNSLELNEQINILSHVFKQSKILEVKNQCLIFLDLRKKKSLGSRHWPAIIVWVKYVDNWAHSDGLSSVFSIMMQHDLDTIYEQLLTWNKSKNPWERRQSVVCLFYYSRTRKNFISFEQSIALITNLLDDKEYYVQKGIGWALREASNVYYDFTFDYIQQHIKQIKPAAYSAAIEKLLPQHKDLVKLLRKKKSTF